MPRGAKRSLSIKCLLIQMEPDEHLRFKTACRYNGRSMGGVIRAFIQGYTESVDKEELEKWMYRTDLKRSDEDGSGDADSGRG